MNDMRTMIRRAALLAFVALAATATGARAASPVAVIDPWSNPASAGGAVQVYATITNVGDDADRLLGATSPSAAAAELHAGAAKPGAPPPAALVVPAHGTLSLVPGGDYVTYTGLKSDVVGGGLFFARLHFERAGWIVAVVHVRTSGLTPAIAAPSGATPVPAYSSQPVIPVPVIQH